MLDLKKRSHDLQMIHFYNRYLHPGGCLQDFQKDLESVRSEQDFQNGVKSVTSPPGTYSNAADTKSIPEQTSETDTPHAGTPACSTRKE